MAKKKTSEPNLINGSELARRLGVSEPAVRKAVKMGRIVPALVDEKGKRWFCEETAKLQWGKNTLPEKSTGRERVKVSKQIPAGDALSVKNLDMITVKKMIGVADARYKDFRVRKAERELVGVEDVARMWERQVEQAKRLFLALPIELRMRIPSLTNDDMTLIENRIVAILNNLASWDPRKASN